MAYENLCMYCFEDLNGESICPHCGRDSRAAVPQIQMLPGTLVYHDRFLVGRAMGQDATGIVYQAFDTKRENKLRLREYLPRDCAERLNDGSVVPVAGMEDAFEKGMRRLKASVDGAQDQSKKHFYFEENGTAYVAQRKNAAAAARMAEEEPEGSGMKQIGIIVGIAAAVVVVAVIVIISLVNGALNTTNDVVTQPSLSPTASSEALVWAPAETPTPTPYATSTFAALVDPEQSWLDYTYNGNVEDDYKDAVNKSATATPRPTAVPTIRPDATMSTTISSKSSSSEITSLQQRLAALGWLDSGKITGSYDSATKQAVKDFQNYVNSAIRPTEKLSVDGIAGPKTLQWLYGTDSAKPTATPTAAVTADPSSDLVVDKNSSKNDIKAVQRKLITLGIMKSGSDDGVYGTTTTAAVKKFQQRVNELQGSTVLSVTGTVDANTMAWLNYYVSWWEAQQQATATPAPNTATPAPTVSIPTATPAPSETDAPDVPEDKNRVDSTSPKESVQYVQQMLISVGLLPSGGDDGNYGDATVNAVIAFQEFVNNRVGAGTVSVTGICDSVTLNYLEYASDNGMVVSPTDAPATATPEPAETDIPDEPEDKVVVDKDSPKESIQYVQQMLISVGLLPSGSDDGVFGNATTNAVIAFQQYVNAQVGAGTVNENGTLDATTLGYLEDYADAGTAINPTAAPTAEPTNAPANVTGVSMSVSGASASGDVYMVDTSIMFNWSADGSVDSYYIYVTGDDGSNLYQEEATDRTQGAFAADSLTAGVTYTLQVGALPTGGSESDMVWTTVQFRKAQSATAIPTDVPTQEPTQAPSKVENLRLTIDGSTADGIVALTNDTATFDWSADGAVGYNVTIVDNSGNTMLSLSNTTQTQGTISKSALTAGEVYTITVEAISASGETTSTSARFGVSADPAATSTPSAYDPVSAPAISIDGTAYSESGVQVLTGTSAIFTWMTTGEVQGYYYYYVNSAGEQTDPVPTTDTSLTVDLTAVAPDTYQFYVGAVPSTATSMDDVIWSSVIFTIPSAE